MVNPALCKWDIVSGLINSRLCQHPYLCDIIIQNAEDYTRLIGPVYIGNEAAAIANSTTNTFTHLLCTAEELDQPEDTREDSEDSEVTFHKVPLQFGVTLPLDDDLFHEAVRIVRKVWKKYLRAPDAEGPSILIYCKYAFQVRGKQPPSSCASVLGFYRATQQC